jgi:flagellar protein FliS
MVNTNYDTYLEAEVLGADPMKLVHMLYRGAAEAVASARRHLVSGDIRRRSRQVTKCWEILQELNQTLDHERGGHISKNLCELYTYMQRRLLEGNIEQIDAPLAEVETLLGTLSEAWITLNIPLPGAEQAEYQPVSCVY